MFKICLFNLQDQNKRSRWQSLFTQADTETYMKVVEPSPQFPLFSLLLPQDDLSLGGEVAHLPPPDVGQVLLGPDQLDYLRYLDRLLRLGPLQLFSRVSLQLGPDLVESGDLVYQLHILSLQQSQPSSPLLTTTPATTPSPPLSCGRKSVKFISWDLARGQLMDTIMSGGYHWLKCFKILKKNFTMLMDSLISN